ANPPREGHRPDNGYSSWVELPDGRIYFVDYSNRGDPPPGAHLYGAYLSPADFTRPWVHDHAPLLARDPAAASIACCRSAASGSPAARSHRYSRRREWLQHLTHSCPDGD